jgi:hypothetical protein
MLVNQDCYFAWEPKYTFERAKKFTTFCTKSKNSEANIYGQNVVFSVIVNRRLDCVT